MSYRTNRRTRQKFITRPTMTEDNTVTITRLGTRLHPDVVIPWNIEARTADGRKFNLRVMALSKSEALAQAHQKFPLIKIHKIYKARIATARRIGERLTRTAERIERALEGSGGDEGESLL
jgi:hypothetical protein